MKVLVFEPGKGPELREVEDRLKPMQALVGGYIEAVNLPKGLVLVCNEFGKIENLEPSAELDVPGMPWDMICGTCFVCRADGDGFVGLYDGDEERVLEYVRPIRSPRNEKAPAGVPSEQGADLKDQQQDTTGAGKSQFDKDWMEHLKRIGSFTVAAYEACDDKERDKNYEFVCPLCGGRAVAWKSPYNGHHHAYCKDCGMSMSE